MNKELKNRLIIAFNNRHIDDVVKVAYEIKPYNIGAVECAKLIEEWFSKENDCNFDKTIARFSAYAEDEANEFAPVAAYMAAKIALFYKKDASLAAQIVRKAYLHEDVFGGLSFMGFYIYQNGLVNDEPDYRLACKYLQDSVNYEMPWFESSSVIEKKSISDDYKYHYAKNVVKYAENEELKAKSVTYLFNYYARTNLLENLQQLFVEVKDNPVLMSSSKDIASASLQRLANYYVGKKEYAKAVTAFEQAASLGNEKANEQLGIAYYQGSFGLTKDIDKAVFYLTKLSKGGMGTFLLGILYERGEGVEKNMDTAFAIYLKCSKTKFAEAFFKLGKIYCEGTYKARDEFLAHRYFEEYKELATNIPLSRLKMIEEYYDSFKR